MVKIYKTVQMARLRINEEWHFFWEGKAKLVKSIDHRFKHCKREIQYFGNGYKVRWNHYPQKGYKEFIVYKEA